jgi:Ca2+-binding RTX toxin-like protein
VASETNGGGTGTSSIAFAYVTIAPTVTIATPSGKVANTAETLDGSGEAGTTIQLYDGSAKLGGTVTVGANGLWSDTVTLPKAGANAITARDTDTANNVGVSVVTTLSLDNQIVGAAGRFTLIGTNGSDHITVGARNIVVATLGGDDTVTLTSAGGAGQFHVIAGGGGSDTLDLSRTSGGATVNLSRNTATGAQIGTNYVFNFDNIIGGGGAETLTGANGGGFIQAGSGNDVLTGGSGANTFEFLAAIGNDTISNFVVSGANHGVVEFDQALFANWAAVNAALTNTSAGAEITLNANETVTLSGVTAAQLQANHASDFKFV